MDQMELSLAERQLLARQQARAAARAHAALLQARQAVSESVKTQTKTEHPVGSLILHAVTDHGNCCGDAHVGSLVLHEDNGSLACDVETCVPNARMSLGFSL